MIKTHCTFRFVWSNQLLKSYVSCSIEFTINGYIDYITTGNNYSQYGSQPHHARIVQEIHPSGPYITWEGKREDFRLKSIWMRKK